MFKGEYKHIRQCTSVCAFILTFRVSAHIMEIIYIIMILKMFDLKKGNRDQVVSYIIIR